MRNVVDGARVAAPTAYCLDDEADPLTLNHMLFARMTPYSIEGGVKITAPGHDHAVILAVALLGGADIPVSSRGIKAGAHVREMPPDLLAGNIRNCTSTALLACRGRGGGARLQKARTLFNG
ncbi:hypothetical protein [Sphingomonas sanxanigenens]|uniref:hypothetical protein n=1 Tax=Sphingomonas sanxanigenens TaxID=397260 RepID=UPI00138F7D42|nr:hypothetical protein [Sphingomonas sanxanigenens]